MHQEVRTFAIIGEYNGKRYAYCCLDDVLPFAIKKRPVNRFESGNLRGDRMSALTYPNRSTYTTKIASKKHDSPDPSYSRLQTRPDHHHLLTRNDYVRTPHARI